MPSLVIKYSQCRFRFEKKCYQALLIILSLLMLKTSVVHSQNIFFNKVNTPPGKSFTHITGMVQDKVGYMWFTSKNGLFRYDGYSFKHYRNDPLNQNSLATDELESICMDRDGIIWIGTFAGLERFDPVKETFTHFRHSAANASSISNDTVNVVFSDRTGNVN